MLLFWVKENTRRWATARLSRFAPASQTCLPGCGRVKKIITSFSKDHPHTHGMRALFFVGFILFVHDSLLAK